MKIRNRLDRSFGPAGTAAGIIVFCAGLILTYFYVSSVILILIGAFAGFTCTVTVIDVDNRRVRSSINYFGLIPAGKWVRILPEMKIGIRESNQTYRSYSQGNRALDVTRKDFRIILYDVFQKEILEVKKNASLDLAKADAETIGNQLGLESVI